MFRVTAIDGTWGKFVGAYVDYRDFDAGVSASVLIDTPKLMIVHSELNKYICAQPADIETGADFGLFDIWFRLSIRTHEHCVDIWTKDQSINIHVTLEELVDLRTQLEQAIAEISRTKPSP